MRNHRHAGRILALSTTAALALAACSWGGGDSDPTAAPTDSPSATRAPITVSMAVWGGFGLDDLATQYEQSHPGVTIDLVTGDYNPLHQDLQSQIVSGTGAPTIAAIGEDYIAQFVAQADQFVDLRTLGASDVQDQYLPWAWSEGSAGSTVVGLPANVSGLALCYRRDLLESAGLPGDRDKLAALIGDTWDGFADVAAQYTDATGKPLLDSATTLLRTVRQQQGTSYYNSAGTLAMDAVKPAFDVALDAIDMHVGAGVTPFADGWAAGLEDGTFAATLCPVWGIGYIQATLTQDGSDAQWDVTDLPGPGGSWGGTFYAIPAQADTEHREAAWEFLTWLQGRDQQVALFQSTGNLPAQPALYDEDAVQKYTNAFFHDAPVGQILAASASELTDQASFAPKDGTVEATVQQVLDEVQSGGVASSDAWQVAKDAAALADSQQTS